ncbi:DUF6538 domain-containing protein [Roseomonas sp. GCM10028921]
MLHAEVNIPIPFLVRRRATWYFRARIPAPLRPLLGTHVVRSTRTGRLAEARLMIPTLLARYNAIWKVIRDMTEQAKGDPEVGSPGFHEIKVGHWRERMRSMDELCEAGDSAMVTLTHGELSEFLLECDPAEQGMRRQADLIADALLRAARRFIQIQGASSEDKVREILAAPTAPPEREPATGTRSKHPEAEDRRRWMRITELEEAYFKDRGFGDSTRASHRTAFREFEELTKGKVVCDITSADVASYKDWLADKPGRRGRERAAHASVEKSLNHVRAFLRWTVDDAGILTHNSGEKVRPPRKPKGEKLVPDRLAFSPDALTTIFSSPLYTGCKGPRGWHIPGPTVHQGPRYYFLLCMLLTGARTEELPGCHVIEHGGTFCLDLRPTATKTLAAPRLVPIIPALERTGFVVWALRSLQDGERLFIDGDVPSHWSNWTNRYLAHLQVTDRHHVAYSLRHNFRQMLRSANLTQELADRVFGHEGESVGGRYGREPVSPTDAALVARMVKPPIPLDHLFRKMQS